MNYKLEKFWNDEWLKGFESNIRMNYKLEKFWNLKRVSNICFSSIMNYKLEKFWNLKDDDLSIGTTTNEL